jgi:hypothetical protein
VCSSTACQTQKKEAQKRTRNKKNIDTGSRKGRNKNKKEEKRE